jgi:hypothetical protein
LSIRDACLPVWWEKMTAAPVSVQIVSMAAMIAPISALSFSSSVWKRFSGSRITKVYRARVAIPEREHIINELAQRNIVGVTGGKCNPLIHVEKTMPWHVTERCDHAVRQLHCLKHFRAVFWADIQHAHRTGRPWNIGDEILHRIASPR